MAGRRRGGGACGACGSPCVVDRSAFISFSSAEISGSDDPSAATSGCGVSSLIVVALSRPAHARSGSHLARRAAAGRVPIAGRGGRRAARGAPRLSRRRALRYGAVTRSLGKNKQGATLPVKWWSLAGLLPGGGLKAGPPLDPPPAINLPFSIRPGSDARTGAGGLRNLRMSEKRRRTGAVWCWPAAKFLHWKPRRREPHTPDTLRTRLRLNMLRYRSFSVQKLQCTEAALPTV